MTAPSKFEAMRTDPANWKLGMIYCCAEDPRIIVRQLPPVGWTWNFARPAAYAAILVAVLLFLGPPIAAWSLGIRSSLALGLVTLAGLCANMLAAHYMSRDPAHSGHE